YKRFLLLLSIPDLCLSKSLRLTAAGGHQYTAFPASVSTPWYVFFSFFFVFLITQMSSFVNQHKN
ncbi:hypothetical protein, partial [uncultured Treponema sp.]|uniref:hypothetical protein n=1 Tax=uncultured Treponema sp. TaxID=162155 RepID=UPI00280BAC06